MQTVEEFLAYAILLEKEAADRYGELADTMEASGNREVGKLFRRLSEYSRMHLADATARAQWTAFSPSRQREYMEWIGEAKTDATRARRHLAATSAQSPAALAPTPTA